MRGRMRQFRLLAIACLVVFSVAAQGATLKVHCGGTGQLATISGALKLLHRQGPNTVTVSGTCTENLDITGFDRLTLIAEPGATINDASAGTLAVVSITDTDRVAIVGFVINGGGTGVECTGISVCSFINDTIQSSVSDGAFVLRSQASFGGGTLQNNAGNGLVLLSSTVRVTHVNILNNGAAGIAASSGSSLLMDVTTIQSNGVGVQADNNSTLRVVTSTITGNSASGVLLIQSSAATFGTGLQNGDTITGNGGEGVLVGDLSFASFAVGNTVLGNATGDVICRPQFPATRGALTNIGGGTTNCIEP